MIDQAIKLIRDTPLEKMDEQFILNLGLNNEFLWEQPKEYAEYYGLGLHMWQYPNQILPLIKKIGNEHVRTYMEIGAHKGGTFILMSEILSKINPNIVCIAVDIHQIDVIIEEYRSYKNFVYVQCDSNTEEFRSLCKNNYIDFVFIDGDHTYTGVKNDYEIFKNKPETKHIVFHDITNIACEDVSKYWNEIKQSSMDQYEECVEFVQQYKSVDKGPYLGIGYLKKRA